MTKWVDVPLNRKLFKNLDEEVLTSTFSALENCFVTEGGGISRFPCLKEFCDLPNNSDVFLGRYDDDLIAVTRDGQTYIVDSEGGYKAIEGDTVAGGLRTSFARTRDGLMMTAGAQIIKFDGTKNEVLSNDAPLSTFVGFLDGYLLAVEKESGLFHHSRPNDFKTWNGDDIFAVDGSPDNISAMLITPFNEILFAGEESVEQYERYVGSNVAFFRRWAIGDGIIEPYTLCHIDNGAWGLNSRMEFIRFSGQTSQSVSDDIQKEIEDKYSLENIANRQNAWAAPCYTKGQKFIILQLPDATNKYGNKGMTLVFDIRRRQWFELFGWDAENGTPKLWEGRSVFQMRGKTYVGGQGKIYTFCNDTFEINNDPQRIYIRTAHFNNAGTIRVNRVRLTLKRGVGTYDFNPKIMFRSNPDNRGWSNLQTREMGKIGDGLLYLEFGAQGVADTWQFEISMTDNAAFELRRMQLDASQVYR